MKLVLLFSVVISFAITYLLMPWFMTYLRGIGLIVKDQHKVGKPLIPISGGIIVFLGIFFGIMFAIFIQTFYYHTTERVIELFAFAISLFAVTFIGFFDDLLIGKNHEASVGLKQWQKPALTIIAAVPLMVINAGETIVTLPFLGAIDVGLLYPLLFIPLAFVGASNMVNPLGGFNGLEAGLGLIYLGNLSAFAYINGQEVSALIGALTCAALIAFLLFNAPPAKIFPGDSLTYLMGGVLASMAIIGNMEIAALLVSIPFFIEFILKVRGKLDKHSFGILTKDGKIKSYYNKVYSLPHILTIKAKYTETQVILFIYALGFASSFLIWII